MTYVYMSFIIMYSNSSFFLVHFVFPFFSSLLLSLASVSLKK